MRATAFMVVLSMALLPTAALADVPGLMSYQGTLTDDSGVALDTTVSMTFTIYNDSTGGSVIWSETQPLVGVTDGVFNVLLGSVSRLSKDDFSGTDLWLGVQVGTDPELDPRQRIVTAGFTFRSSEADTADYARSADVGSDGDWTISGSDLYSAVAGDVGIGTMVPEYKLDVRGGRIQLKEDASGDWIALRTDGGALDLQWDSGNLCVQSATDGEHILLNPSNANSNVGIGTSNPLDKVHVRGNDPALRLQDTGGGNTYIRFELPGEGWHDWEIRTGANGFFIKDTAAVDDYVTIKTDGNVGIGTTNPAARLDVRGTLNVGEDGAGHDVNFYRDGTQKGFFWDASWSALRAGYDSDGTHWASDSIGVTSFAAGYNPKAKGAISIAMGLNTTASGYISTALGDNAEAKGDRSIALGRRSIAYGSSSIAAGYMDSTFGFCGGVLSGAHNLAGHEEADTAAFVGGGWGNSVESAYGTICGGKYNRCTGWYSVIGGGEGNVMLSGAWAIIGSGLNNLCQGSKSVVGGGELDTCLGKWSVICGGYDNRQDGEYSAIGGGKNNNVRSDYSTISGGQDHFIGWTSDWCTIAGGERDTIFGSADRVMVFGQEVYVANDDRVVFFDGDHPGRFGLNRDYHDGGISFPIHVGTDGSNGNGAFLSGGGSWIDGSSRTFKENFQSINGTDLLSKIDQMPIEFWEYKDSDERHIGPVAEDFVAAFDVGTVREDGSRENQYLAARDVAGVALAGIKELLKENQELKQSLEALKREIAELKRQ